MRVVRFFPSKKARLRLVMAVVVEISEECVTGKCSLNMGELKLEHKEEAVDAIG
jgi:hypothetical protein